MSTEKIRIGVVGGGQLAGMLTDACKEEEVSCTVLDPDALCPAVLAGAGHVEGDSWNLDALKQLAEATDVVTVEIENVDIDNLAVLEAEGVRVIPGTGALSKLVNKRIQKETLNHAGIPTAPFLAAPAGESIDHAPFGMPLVWKASRGGYDGRGVIVIDDETDLPLTPDVDGYIEAFVEARMEIAVMVAVSQSGERATWTCVEMDFSPETNMLSYLISPARVSEKVDRRVRELAIDAIAAIGGPGIFGVEMFLTEDDEILINEIAPRAHNSGHVTMDNAETSQFQQQCRILQGSELASTTSTTPAVMVNVLGKKGYNGATVVENLAETRALPGVHVHLYGKQRCFTSRKMGHATITADTIDEAIRQSEKVQSQLVVRGAEQGD